MNEELQWCFAKSLAGHDKETVYIIIPGSKGLNPYELAHMWVNDLGTRPNMSIKVG